MTTTAPQRYCGSNVALKISFPLMASLESTTHDLAVGSQGFAKNVIFLAEISTNATS